MMRAAFAVAVLASLAVAGCSKPGPTDDSSYASLGFTGADTTGRAAAAWPDLNGTTLTILDHGAFSAFDHAAAQFHNLTGATVVHIEADDAGGALNRAILERGSPSADVLYGIDNVLLQRAQQAAILEPYTPLLASRVPPSFVFFDPDHAWPATPVDHGFIGINWDGNATALHGVGISSLDDVRKHADQFVTEDPNTSSVGLGFLLSTIATYGESGWHAYWESLFAGHVLVTSGWSDAYEQHFSGGYGPSIGGLGDKSIVASYTESPAYEAFYGRPPGHLAIPLTAARSTFEQVQTMAILKGTHHRAAAQAWIEFTLTDAFQKLAAPDDAVYPVVAGINANTTYGKFDPEPGTFEPAKFSSDAIGTNLERWLREWTTLCESHSCR